MVVVLDSNILLKVYIECVYTMVKKENHKVPHNSSQMYCMACKKKQPVRDVTSVKNAGGQPMLKAICTVCGTKCNQFQSR